MRKSALSLIIVGLAAAFTAAQADMLAQWTFASDLNPTSTAPDVTASALGDSGTLSTAVARSGGNGIEADGSNYTGGNALNDINGSDSGGADGRAFARIFGDLDADYFSFNITLGPGTNYQLDNVQFDAGFRSGGPNHMRVQYSLASDFSNPVTIGEGAGWLDDPTTGLDYGPDADSDAVAGLPSLGVVQPGGSNFSWNRFDNDGGGAPISDTVYFQVQATGSTLTNSDATFYLDNITVEGSVIPEPGTLALLGMAIGLLFYFRRRR